MAGSMSDYSEGKLVDHICGTTTYTKPTCYLALFTTNPNFETGASGTEATGGSYARKAIAFGAASGGQASNSGVISWTVGTDCAAQTMTGWGVYDDPSAGNLLFGDTFSSNKVLTGTGDVLSFAIGSVTCSLT